MYNVDEDDTSFILFILFVNPCTVNAIVNVSFCSSWPELHSPFLSKYVSSFCFRGLICPLIDVNSLLLDDISPDAFSILTRQGSWLPDQMVI